ncbi:MAG: methyltransferase [Actinomycetota bacterium]|nr:methyltransferase [Actinomycetota bacterium]
MTTRQPPTHSASASERRTAWLLVLGLTAAPLPNSHAELRTGGLYRFVRHPIYGGLLLLAIALTLASASSWTTMACVALVALINAQARWEERRLTERFPAYAAYADCTPRFIPGLTR